MEASNSTPPHGLFSTRFTNFFIAASFEAILCQWWHFCWISSWNPFPGLIKEKFYIISKNIYIYLCTDVTIFYVYLCLLVPRTFLHFVCSRVLYLYNVLFLTILWVPFSPSQRRRFPEAAAETPRFGKHRQHGRENRRRPGGGLFVWLEMPGVSDLGCCLNENHAFLEGLRKTRELEHSNFESSFGQLMLIQSPYIYIYIFIVIYLFAYYIL